MNQGWKIKKLVEIAKVFEDGDWIESKDQSLKGIRLIQTGNVGEGIFKDRAEKARYISSETFKRLRCTEIFEGDCLVSRLPDPVGRTCVLPKSDEQMITAVDCSIIRFNHTFVLSEWFVYFSLSREYAIQIDKQITGATRQRISRTNLGLIEIPIPPLPEQQRIVSILDEAFAAIAKAKANAERNLKNAKELFESYLQGVFENPNNKWSKTKLGDVCGFVRGPFGGSLKKNIFKSEGYAVYEQQHAIYDQFDDVRYFIDENKFNEMKRFELNSGDLIMSCSGTMGKIAIVPDKIKRGIINQALLKLSPSKSVSNVFLKLWMQSKSFQNSLKDYSGGAAIQNVASVATLKNIEIPLPAITLQNKIVQDVRAFSAETKKLETIYQQKLNNLEELKKSLLQKAFGGELKVNIPISNVIDFPVKISNISITDLHAGIIAIALQRHQDKNQAHTFHHVKSEKIIHMAESFVGIDLERNPFKDAAGPNDFPKAKKVESRASKAGFFSLNNNGGIYVYSKGNQFEKLIDKAKLALNNQLEKLLKLIDLMVPMTTQQAEIFATVYAAWNNLLLDGKQITDESIVIEARENWHKDKLKIPREKFFNAISWMKKQNIIPEGKGKRVLAKTS